jgi:hypothetical protein
LWRWRPAGVLLNVEVRENRRQDAGATKISSPAIATMMAISVESDRSQEMSWDHIFARAGRDWVRRIYGNRS